MANKWRNLTVFNDDDDNDDDIDNQNQSISGDGSKRRKIISHNKNYNNDNITIDDNRNNILKDNIDNLISSKLECDDEKRLIDDCENNIKIIYIYIFKCIILNNFRERLCIPADEKLNNYDNNIDQLQNITYSNDIPFHISNCNDEH